MTNINLFSQIISKLDKHSFRKLVSEKQTDKYPKGYNSLERHGKGGIKGYFEWKDDIEKKHKEQPDLDIFEGLEEQDFGC